MFSIFSMFSLFSQLTPIPNGRMEQFVEPCRPFSSSFLFRTSGKECHRQAHSTRALQHDIYKSMMFRTWNLTAIVGQNMLALCVDILSRSPCTKCATPIPSSLFPPFLNPQMPRAPQIAFLLSHLSHPVLIDALCIHIYCACIPFLIFLHITFQRACELRALGLLLADSAPTVG